jgi:hypothetical protein
MRALFVAVLCSAVFAGTLYLGGQSVEANEGPPASSGVAKVTRPNKQVIRFNSADQAVARAALVTRADLGGRWKGGRKKADLTSEETCANYRPRMWDIVLTGAAESEFSHPAGFYAASSVRVVQTPRMLRLDWKRAFEHPNALSCLRRVVARDIAKDGFRLISLRVLPFPRVAPYVKRIRVIQEVRRSGRKLRVLVDIIAFGERRTELTLAVGTPLARRAGIERVEKRLARTMLARVRGATDPGRPVRSAPARQVARGLTVYDVPGARFSIGVPPDWTVMTAKEAYGSLLREAFKQNPQLRQFRDVFSTPGSPFKLVAAKTECGGGCTTLNVLAMPRTPDWRPREFEAGALHGARQIAVAGTRPTFKRIRLAVGRAVRIRFRAQTPFGVMAATQYVVHTRTTAFILGYGTPPKFARRYAAVFERSARSLRQRD